MGTAGVDTLGVKPLVPTGALGSVPSEEVAPSGGIVVPTWANAGPQHNRVVATIINLIGDPLFERREYAAERAQGAAVDKAAEAMAFIFMAVGKG